MIVGIRADGNSQIGMGHMQRCLSIAKELSIQGQKCVFFVADQEMTDIIGRENYYCISLESEWNDLNTEIASIKKYIEELQIDFLLIDTYFVTNNYLREIQSVCRIAYIDDLFEVIYPYDILINYAIYSRKYLYEKHYTEKTKLLLGTQYMPLREQFRNAEKKKIKKNVENILIMTGGTDNYGIAMHLVEALLVNRECSNYQFNVICGKFSKQYDALIEKERDFSNLKVKYDVKDMASVMREADMAISASGTTLYELAAVGTPFICFTVADNQIENAQTFHDKGLAIYAGDARDGLGKLIQNIIQQRLSLSEDYTKRKRISEELQNLVDGYGAERIVDVITNH